ncbi:hypothetical protein BJX66DRAFT_67557 [Aspergillus keveii]|uniref:Secreted protein n=1 Tax=Aspergillus keveii TaxID=714993 RepID=A0ABR4FPJ1_9EURO
MTLKCEWISLFRLVWILGLGARSSIPQRSRTKHKQRRLCLRRLSETPCSVQCDSMWIRESRGKHDLTSEMPISNIILIFFEKSQQCRGFSGNI